MTKSSRVLQNVFQLFRRINLIKKNQNSNNINNPFMVGRWKLDYDNAIQTRKVYWANMDHCGCCDMKTIEAIDQKFKKYKDCKLEDSEEYILPYVM